MSSGREEKLLRRRRNLCMTAAIILLVAALTDGIPPFLHQRQQLAQAQERVLELQQKIKDRNAELLQLEAAIIAGQKRLVVLQGGSR